MSLQTFLDSIPLIEHAPNCVAKLRELILQLSIQGKLVPQDVREESAALLAEKIATEKERLASERGLKPLGTMTVPDDEAPYALPKGWIWTRLANVGFINPRNNSDDSETASFVPMSLVPLKYGEPVKTESRPWGEIKRGFTHFANGDVVSQWEEIHEPALNCCRRSGNGSHSASAAQSSPSRP